MPTAGSQRRAFRLEDDALWEEFRIAAEALGTDRSAVLREFIKWFVLAKGAKKPVRPLPSTVDSYRFAHGLPPRHRAKEPGHD